MIFLCSCTSTTPVGNSIDGKILAGPLEAEEGILYAEIDLQQIITAKRMFDAAGHYSRPDVFEFKVNRRGK